ncbi:hypothetical protein Hte_009161 [Hypoxylon texense]
MKHLLLPILLAAAAAATASARAFDSIYHFGNGTSSTSSTSSSSSALPGVPTPPPVNHMACSGGLDTPCQGLCVCSGTTVNCHADPTGRCVQMCTC